MNIAYKGNFLREGLLALGHALFPIEPAARKPLGEQLRGAPVPIDLVIWEMYGSSAAISGWSEAGTPSVAWCIDSPINEFWFREIGKNFDYVFVDQFSSVHSLAKWGLKARWLPLPAQQCYFRADQDKEYDIAFVGTLNGERQKRANLINLTGKKFNIHLASGLSLAATQDVFARARIVLNENFFHGLTLRILQGLAAGAVVLTEDLPEDARGDFEAEAALVRYNGANVLEKAGAILADYDSYAQMARRGREICAASCTASDRAWQMLAVVANGAGNVTAGCHWRRIRAEALFCQRFGGNLGALIPQAQAVAREEGPYAAEAALTLGQIWAIARRADLARQNFIRAAELGNNDGYLKLALLHIALGEPQESQKCLELFVRGADLPHEPPPATEDALLMSIGRIYLDRGRGWDMGFYKSFADPAPDTAFEVANLAWTRKRTPAALELMLACLRPFHMEGELLPRLLQGAQENLLSRPMLLEAARLARDYYDPETAARLMKDCPRRRQL